MDDSNANGGGFTRRSVLHRGATVAGTAVVGTAAVSGTAAADEHDGQDEKRGGRGRMEEGDARRNEPFTIEFQETAERRATCMAGESAPQVYIGYRIEYCDGEEGTLYVIPDEAPLNPSETYEFRAVTPCRDTDDDKVAFGPSDEEC